MESIDAAADALTGVLRGKTGPMRDIALLNGAAALVVAEKAKDLKEGFALARESVDAGKAVRVLELLVAESKGG